jgi:Holliday junction resolvase
MATEKNFENKVKEFLKDQGCWFIKYWGGGQFTKEGIPDILCCCNGHFLGIEIKAPKGRPSPLQIHNLKKIDEAGGYGVLLYPKDFDTFKLLVKNLNESNIASGLSYEALKGRWME